MASKHVVVDGSNIATEGRSRPSLEQLDEAVRAFLDDRPHDKLTVVVDATFGHRIAKSESKAFEEAIEAGEIVMPPAGAIGRGDAFVLEIADRSNATVLSNDSFQEFHPEYPWLFDEGRLIGGKPVPEVGWVFLDRTPVRGPVSRRAGREAAKAKKAGGRKARKGKSTERGSKKSKGTSPKKSDKKKSDKKKSGKKKSGKRTTTPSSGKRTAKTSGSSRKAADSGSGRRKPTSPLNDPLPFIEFVAAHPVGSRVTGTVEQFSSHGAFVQASGARCYVPLKAMGDPPPQSPKEVLSLGDDRDFVVSAIDTPRRGIDLALSSGAVRDKNSTTRSGVARNSEVPDIAEEAPVTPAKRTTRKKRKAPAKRKKAPAKRKTTARKRKAPAKRKTAAKRKAPAKRKKKAPAKRKKKAPAKRKKKAPAKRKKKAPAKRKKKAPAKRKKKAPAKRKKKAPAKRKKKAPAKRKKKAPAKRKKKAPARRRR